MVTGYKITTYLYYLLASIVVPICMVYVTYSLSALLATELLPCYILE